MKNAQAVQQPQGLYIDIVRGMDGQMGWHGEIAVKILLAITELCFTNPFMLV